MLPADLRYSFLPFVRPDYVEGMVIGDDLDSLLSALYLHHRYGWPVVAAYTQYTRLWYVGDRGHFLRQMQSGRLCAVDLDVYYPTLPNIGHHILHLGEHDGDLPGLSHSLNPNSLRGLSIRQGFTRKYPLATIHLLLWLLEEAPLPRLTEQLVWLADSTYINAQRYAPNVQEWVQHFFARNDFARLLPLLQTPEYEHSLQADLLRPLSANRLCHPSSSRYRSVHLGLSGFQAQWQHPLHDGAALRQLLHTLSAITGWAVPPFPLLEADAQHHLGCLSGHRQEIAVPLLQASGLSLSDWLEREGVFSYAFTFRDRLNYTKRLPALHKEA